MAFSPFADVEVQKLSDLKPQWFFDHGIKLMLLDFDNTVVPYTIITPTEDFNIWLKETRDAGVTVAVVSNSRSDRVQNFCRERDIPCTIRAKKPRPNGILEAMASLGFAPEETAMAGDQTFTDILAGNFAGVTSVLVYPILFSNPLFRVRYWMELPFICFGRRRRKNGGR